MDAAVITARDEAGTIGELVAALKRAGLCVLVADDGSADDTAMAAYEAGADVVIWRDHAIGIGPSLRELWGEALTMGAERVVQLDAGGSHDPAEADYLLLGLDLADVVIGSRFRGGSRYVGGSRWRRLGSRLAAWLCNLAQPGAHWSDWTSGYRAFRRRALAHLAACDYFATGHAWQIEVLATAGASGWLVSEVAIGYRAGRSSLRLSGLIEALNVWSIVLCHIGGVR